ncbi:MAG: hypothetical protein Tsb0014_40000 [Pleurocapsa sp.]
MLQICREINNFKDLRVFYQKCGYGGGVKQEDLVFIAQIDSQLVGAVRLCTEMNVLVLRGMQVLPEFQYQRIGTQLLQYCDRYFTEKSCYCLPWRHLRSFYEQIGFELISPAKLPEFLNQRFQRYLAQEMNVIAMYKLNS